MFRAHLSRDAPRFHRPVAAGSGRREDRTPQRLWSGRLWERPGSSTRASVPPDEPRPRAVLLLEDGTRFEGTGVGAATTAVGEVVFTTGMVGYPESLTDPSFRGQILAFTYPLLGNYGVPSPGARDPWGLPRFLESPEVQVRGFVARAVTPPSHWNGSMGLPEWLARSGVPGIVGVDTRRLTEHLRIHGVLRGVLAAGSARRTPSNEELRQRLRRAPGYADENLVAEVSPTRPLAYAPNGSSPNGEPLVALLDCGTKASIVRALLARRLGVLRLPYDAPVPERWDGRRIEALLVGNGPGDPVQLTTTIDEIRRATRADLPVLGICLGQQLLSLARGGRTFKLKFGHRGQNKTVRFSDGRAMIVSENHGYAVDPGSLRGSGLVPWAVNPDDGTLEAVRDRSGRLLALQGHPEGHPGPQEAGFVFDRFVERVRRRAG
jgi:carbamoyl-phosphate synthase small subunit